MRETDNVHMKTMSKKPELRLKSEWFILFWPLVLSFKADDSRAHVNNAMGLEPLQPQELRLYSFILLNTLLTFYGPNIPFAQNK